MFDQLQLVLDIKALRCHLLLARIGHSLAAYQAPGRVHNFATFYLLPILVQTNTERWLNLDIGRFKFRNLRAFGFVTLVRLKNMSETR